MSKGIQAASAKVVAEIFATGVIAKGYNFQALHEYTDDNGDIIYWRIRYRHPGGEKWMRPLHKGADNLYYLAEPPKFKDRIKPLYGLHLLANNPSAKIWIVEGEWCADNFNRFFEKFGVMENHIAITSGSATSAPGADWIVLRGRDCIIWPDNCESGDGYKNKVLEILRGLK